jgi:hypothetical protein
MFPKLPTEKDHAAVAEVGKVTESDVQIFNQYAHLLDRLNIAAYLLQAVNIEGAHRTAASILCASACFANVFSGLQENLLRAFDGGQAGMKLRDEAIRFRKRKQSVVLLEFVVVRHGSFRPNMVM